MILREAADHRRQLMLACDKSYPALRTAATKQDMAIFKAIRGHCRRQDGRPMDSVECQGQWAVDERAHRIVEDLAVVGIRRI